jgi:GTPase SAR1 family protein
MSMWSPQPSNNQPNTTVVNNSEPPKIRLGIWGSPNAGKTIFAIMLHHYLANQKESPWRVRTKDRDTREFAINGQKLIFDRGEMPSSTEVTADPKVYSYILNSRNNLPDIELNFFDLSGEAYTTRRYDTQVPDPSTGKPITIPQYLNKCDGILFLLSPLETDVPRLEDGTKDGLKSLLQELVDDMLEDRPQQSGRLEQYISFCITKADHDDVRTHFSTHLPEESLLTILGKNCNMQWFDNNFIVTIEKDNKKFVASPDLNNRCQAFYVSPFGSYKDEKNGEMVSPIIIDTNTYESSASTTQSSPSNSPFSTFPGGNNMSVNTLSSRGRAIVKPDAPAFNPVNMITPLEWLIRGILHNPPQIRK